MKETSETKEFTMSCPVPVSDQPNILLAHGGGGKLTHQLLENIFLPAFGNPALNQQHDGAVVRVAGANLAFTTDSYVVRPLFFPGGDIGTLAVNGTVNDLAMCGARPLYLSCAFIMEEGLPIATLRRVVDSMKNAAEEAGVKLVTGDTKVVDKGKGDGLFLNTAGIGVLEHNMSICPASIREGDCILLSGDIGRHGMAIMGMREGLEFEGALESDCAPLAAPVLNLIEAGVELHCLRDLTRGGLANALVELALAARVQIAVQEEAIPVQETVRGACEILGLDPLYVANEGRFVAFVPRRDAAHALAILRSHAVGKDTTIIGAVEASGPRQALLRNTLGTDRVLDMLMGEQLPRIC